MSTSDSIPSDERPFLDAILANPNDDEPRLVYADWLEEGGDERAEDVRAIVAGNDERSTTDLDPDWLWSVHVPTIVNCPADEPSSCPRLWHELPAGESPDLRRCHVCERDVLRTTPAGDAGERAALGDVVAVPTSNADWSHLDVGAFVCRRCRSPVTRPLAPLRDRSRKSQEDEHPFVPRGTFTKGRGLWNGAERTSVVHLEDVVKTI